MATQLNSYRVPALIFVGTLLLYLATLTQVHTFDALSYILDVDRKPVAELFHPHHLAYGPFGAMVKQLATLAGYAGSAALPLQMANALAGALGAALFSGLVRRITEREDLALTGGVLLAASYAYWYYAVEVEVYTIAALFLIICLGLLARLCEHSSWQGWAALGLVQGLAVLFHQTNVLLCVPVAVVLVIDGRWWTTNPALVRFVSLANARASSGRVAGYGFAYGLPLALVVGGAYLWAGFGVSGFRSWNELLEWMAGYASTGWWGGAPTAARLGELGVGLADTLAQPGGAFLGLVLLVLLLTSLPQLCSVNRRLTLALLTWLLVYGGFFFWWEPDNIEFWIASLPPGLLLLLLGAEGRPWRGRLWVGLGAGVALLLLNYSSIMRRGDATQDLQRVIAGALAQASSPGDLLLLPDGIQELYLPYYEGRENVLSLNQALGLHNGDWEAACKTVRERIVQAEQSGFALIVGAEAFYPPPGEPTGDSRGRGILERFGLSREQVSGCFADYLPLLARLDLGPGLPAYLRLPDANELAAGPGWDFYQGRRGWLAANVTDEHFSPGWQFVPGSDPALTSPVLALDLRQYKAIEVRMAASTAGRDAQLFWLDEHGQADERRSLRWDLLPGEEAHTYYLPLPTIANKTTGLRLDPVGVGDGGWVRVEWLRLVAK